MAAGEETNTYFSVAHIQRTCALVHEPVLLLDPCHKIVFCNAAFMRLFGFAVNPEGLFLTEAFSLSHNKESAFLGGAAHPAPRLVHMLTTAVSPAFCMFALGAPGQKERYVCTVTPAAMGQDGLFSFVLLMHASTFALGSEMQPQVSQELDALRRERALLLLENAEKTAVAQALRRAEARYRDIFDSASEGIFQWTPQRTLSWSNGTFANMLGFETVNSLLTHFTQTPFAFIASPEREQEFMLTLEQQGALTDFECLIQHQEEAVVWASINARRVPGPDGSTAYYEAFIENITSRKSVEAKLLFQAFHDPLTGLANRALFTDRLNMTLRRATRQKNISFSVCFLDLDRFKRVNDTYGHKAGDIVLQHAAAALLACVRDSDTVARFGGDEFGIILENTTSTYLTNEIVERIHRALCQPVTITPEKSGGATAEVTVGASIGLVHNAELYDSMDAILRDADTAMYAAKSSSETSIQIFSPAIDATVKKRSQLEEDLRSAFEKNGLFLEYQPLVSDDQPEPVVLEALVRWNSALGILYPEDTLPSIQEFSLETQLTLHVWELACLQVAQWQVAAKKPFIVQVNMQASQLLDAHVSNTLQLLAQKHGAAAHHLRIEVKELSLLRLAGKGKQAHAQLAAFPFGLVLDDMNEVVSSEKYLSTVPFTAVKIPLWHITESESTPFAQHMLHSLFKLGAPLGIPFVAVGVENTTQLAALRADGCRAFQGFYFSHPLSAQKAFALLQ